MIASMFISPWVRPSHHIPHGTRSHVAICLLRMAGYILTNSGSAGIHIGQSDTPLHIARALLGPSATIGVSVSNLREAMAAGAGGADYVGIGPVWPTGSKDVSKKVLLGPEGVGTILDHLAGTPLKAVAIGELSSALAAIRADIA